MVDTVAVAGDRTPRPRLPEPAAVSWVVPRPGTGCWAAVLSPPATNTSPSTVTAAAPASGSGSSPMTARRVPGRVDLLDDAHRRAGLRTRDGLAAEDEDLPVERGHGRVPNRDP